MSTLNIYDPNFGGKIRQVQNATFLKCSTNADGSSFVAFPDCPANQLAVLNNTGTTLEFQRDPSEDSFTLKDGQAWLFRGIGNAKAIAVRRLDQSTSSVEVSAEAELL